MTQPLRLIFAGTPEFAASHLSALLDSEHAVLAVLTQPDRPSGRGKKIQPSPVKACALEAELPVLQPTSLKSDDIQTSIARYNPDVIIVVAYGLILPQAVLDLPRYGCINVHASLLPRWRGAAPIQRAIEAGDAETGVTIMRMEAGLDTGPMLARASTAISDSDTSGALHDRLAALGPRALLSVLADIEGKLDAAEPQDDQQATYAEKISKAEGRIDWRQSSTEIARRIRAFIPGPGCYTELDEQRIKLWEAVACADPAGAAPGTIIEVVDDAIRVACGTGSLRISKAQFPGGKALPMADLLNARAALLKAGVTLGNTS